MEGFLVTGSGLEGEVLAHGKALVAPAGHGGKIGLRPLGNSGGESPLQFRPRLRQRFLGDGQGGVGLFQLRKTGVDRRQLLFQLRPVAQGFHPAFVLADAALQPLLLLGAVRQQPRRVRRGMGQGIHANGRPDRLCHGAEGIHQILRPLGFPPGGVVGFPFVRDLLPEFHDSIRLLCAAQGIPALAHNHQTHFHVSLRVLIFLLGGVVRPEGSLIFPQGVRPMGGVGGSVFLFQCLGLLFKPLHSEEAERLKKHGDHAEDSRREVISHYQQRDCPGHDDSAQNQQQNRHFAAPQTGHGLTVRVDHFHGRRHVHVREGVLLRRGQGGAGKHLQLHLQGVPLVAEGAQLLELLFRVLLRRQLFAGGFPDGK